MEIPLNRGSINSWCTRNSTRVYIPSSRERSPASRQGIGGGGVWSGWKAHNIQHRGTVNIVMHHSRLAAAFRGSIARRGMAPASPLTLSLPSSPLILSRQGASRHLTRDLFARGGNGRGDKIPWRELWGRLLGRWSKGKAVLERGLITGTRSRGVRM